METGAMRAGWCEGHGHGTGTVAAVTAACRGRDAAVDGHSAHSNDDDDARGDVRGCAGGAGGVWGDDPRARVVSVVRVWGEEQARVLACRPDDDDRGVNLVGA